MFAAAGVLFKSLETRRTGRARDAEGRGEERGVGERKERGRAAGGWTEWPKSTGERSERLRGKGQVEEGEEGKEGGRGEAGVRGAAGRAAAPAGRAFPAPRSLRRCLKLRLLLLTAGGYGGDRPSAPIYTCSGQKSIGICF